MHPAPNRFANLSPLKQALLAVEELQERLARSEARALRTGRHRRTGLPVSACRDTRRFWELLRNGEDAWMCRPRRWRSMIFTIPIPIRPAKCPRGSAGSWTASTSSIRNSSASRRAKPLSMDPQQRLLLEVCWEALEQAASAPERLAEQPHGRLRRRDFGGILPAGPPRAQGVADARRLLRHRQFAQQPWPAGRISHVLGLHGPSLVDRHGLLLVAGGHAPGVPEPAERRVRVALAGGVQRDAFARNASPGCKPRMLAADGRCKTFDAARRRLCPRRRLRRLRAEAALRRPGRRRPILAVIRGSAVNQDGRQQRPDGAQRRRPSRR